MTSPTTSEVKVETGFDNIATPSLLSTVETSMLVVIKVIFYGLQMGEIAPKPIDVHVGTCTPTRRYFLFSISSFLANFEVDIQYAHGATQARAWGVTGDETAEVRRFAYPEHKGNTTELRTPPRLKWVKNMSNNHMSVFPE